MLKENKDNFYYNETLSNIRNPYFENQITEIEPKRLTLNPLAVLFFFTIPLIAMLKK